MPMKSSRRVLFVLYVGLLVGPAGEARSQQADTLVLRNALALALPSHYADLIVAPNTVEAKLATGAWRPPRAGETARIAGEEFKQWQAITANETGWFSDSILAGCYVYMPVEAEQRKVVILQAMGDEMVYVHGAPRAGNPYCLKDGRESWEPDFNISFLPVLLEKGRNDLLFRCARGRLKVRLFPPEKGVFFNTHDVTIPDLVVGEKTDAWGSIVVVNATAEPLRDLLIQAAIPRNEAEPVPVPIIQPLTVRKIGFHLTAAAAQGTGTVDVIVNLLRKGRVLDTVTIPFRIVDPYDNRKETFISSIDGSVQYYGINPARAGKDTPAALFLSLHGASVEAVNQSASYEAKTWGHVVAPTNRRPYGFNWEWWGCLDALEAIRVVKSRHNIDESRIYLTGHSMGGHGAWHVGSLFPDQFAAIGPSAGWISFWTYRFKDLDLGDTSAVRRMIRRSTTPSETFEHVDNLRQLGVYVLHGADDDNVPVTESRTMVDSLKKAGVEFVYHEQPGVGHWWDLSNEPGVDCVDWAPMFDFFARHARPGKDEVREVHFRTSNPGVSATDYWLTIDAQERQLEMSSVDVRFDPGMNRFVGTTKNVSRLAFDLSIARAEAPVVIELDGQKMTADTWSFYGGRLWFERKGGAWAVARQPSADLKGAQRYGTFKEAFRNRPILVFGTKGNKEENEWAFNKARYDAEKLWYQGNSSIDIVADVKFDPSADRDRNVVLYGNRETNAAWTALLSKSPVQVFENLLRIGDYEKRGKDISCIFVRPRPGSSTASVGVVSGTGVVGMRLANRLPYLSPGINLPDCTVMNLDVLTKGDSGVLLTGFFGLDWGLRGGELLWFDGWVVP